MTYDSLTEDQRYHLLQLIQERPILYDRNHELYKNASEKDIAWIEVAERCNAQVTACKVAWKSMRDQYQRNMRLPKDRRRKFRYLPKMSFLSGFTKGTKNANSTSVEDITEYYYENTSDIPKHEMEYDDGESTDYGDYNDTTTIEPAEMAPSISDDLKNKSTTTNSDKIKENKTPLFSPHEEEYIFIKDRRDGDDTVENIASELFDTFNNLLNKRFQPDEDDNDIFLKMLAKKMKPLPKLVKNRLQECFLEQVNYEIVNYEVQKQNKK